MEVNLAESEIKEGVAGILTGYGRGKDYLINILQEVQEKFGYIPAPAMQQVADFLGLSNSTVFGVATFYHLFRFVPSGKHTVRVCRGTACHVRGGARILRDIERHLGVKPGETTPDREYTLETVACIGACALAPNMTLDKETYGQLTAKKVAEIFGEHNKK